MEDFVAELEAYLTVTGLKDYELTQEEEKALQNLENLQWGEYRIGDLFYKRTIRGVPKNQENLIKNNKGYHVFG